MGIKHMSEWLALSVICYCITITAATGRALAQTSCATASDWTSCGRRMVCWQGNCVVNQCLGSACNASANSCTSRVQGVRPCIPTTGECQPASKLVLPKADGTRCGKGLVCWKGDCVQDMCGQKVCPVASLAVCMKLAPQGTSGQCNLATGQCEAGPFIAEQDGTNCGAGTCMGGQCVPTPPSTSPDDKCKDVLCPMVSPPLCYDLVGTDTGSCDPATGDCTIPQFMPMPNGSPCGWQGETCQNGQCV